MSKGWMELLRGGNAARSAVIGGGMVLHAINVFIVVTILPTVVREIGGLRYFAWNTTLYVMASLIGGACCARLLRRYGPRPTYRLALGVFALGTATCALAPAMSVLLAGRFVQGLGAGTLSALSFTMVRLLFPEWLWTRGFAVISATWGAATLLGPAVGGVFAGYHAWRAAFWSLLAATPFLALLVEFSLPRDMSREGGPLAPLAVGNLALLAACVLCISAGSMSLVPAWNLAALGAAVAGLALFTKLESGAGARVLPHGACNPATPLGAVYAAMLALLIAVTAEIFVPYFLQTLHGLPPLHAGYLSALMSLGWTCGSVTISSLAPRTARAALSYAPLVLASGLLGLSVLMPWTGLPENANVLIAICLVAMGFGIGVCWPQLGTLALQNAPEGEKELAAASITTVVMVGNAFGSALGGVVTNLAGLSVPGGVHGAASAAGWLFRLYIAAPLLAMLAIRRLLSSRMPIPAE
jgi:MFS family permease